MQQSLNGVRLLPSDTVAFTNPLGRVVDANMWYAVTARGARESYLTRRGQAEVGRHEDTSDISA